MKKTKSLVITSLLFSAMALNPSTIQGLVVQAADSGTPAGTSVPETPSTGDQSNGNQVGPETTEKITVTLKFVDSLDKKAIETTAPITTTVQKTETGISVSNIKRVIDDSKDPKLSGYTLASDKNVYTITDDKEDKVAVVELAKIEATKSIKVNYISDDKDDKAPFSTANITVNKEAKDVKVSDISLPEHYKLTSDVSSFTIKEDGSIDVHVTPNFDKTGTIIVKYQIDNSKDGKEIPNSEIKDVPNTDRYMSIDKITIPEGYELSDKSQKQVTIANGIVVVNVKAIDPKKPVSPAKPGKPSTSVKPGSTAKPSTPVVDKTTYKTTVNFIDQATKKKVNTSSVSGKNGQKVTLTVPEGYELAKGISKQLTIDKNKKTVEVKVVKSAKAQITAFKGLISTKNPAALYSKDGKRVANRGLSKNSDWMSDKKMVLNGETYYGVSTNEFVKASDIFEYQTVNTIIKTSNGVSKHLYNSKGEMVSNRALAPNTFWRTDKTTRIDGKDAYRVSTNEWVFASDLG